VHSTFVDDSGTWVSEHVGRAAYLQGSGRVVNVRYGSPVSPLVDSSDQLPLLDHVHLLDTLSLVAPSDATVLLLGESGTGKEVVAKAIHRNSPRRERPMVKVSCAALPETLLESELFGHERGAFTGAVARKRGRFELAQGGTLFLDEIGEMPLSTQVKLLRVIQEREVQPLGSETVLPMDVRIIAATNRDLTEEVAQARFREDLYWRLNVVSALLPPLRERREDIPLLAEHFLKIFMEKNRKMLQGFTPGVSNLFLRYGWPGNVRELENVVERGVILTRGDRIGIEALPPQMQELAGGESEAPEIRVGLSLKEVEREMVIQTLRETGGNRTQAAAILGITRKTLLNKIKEFKFPWEPQYLAMTEDLIFPNTFKTLREFCGYFDESGTKPEMEIYDVGMINNVAHLIQAGHLKKPVYLQFVMGILGGIPATLENLMFMHKTAKEIIGDFQWSAFGAGRHQMNICTAALLMGGNARVGLEDSVYIGKGQMAKSNAEQVEKIVRIARELGIEPATPDEARQMLGLKGLDKVGF